MKPQELRLGNWVNVNADILNFNIRVEEILPDGIGLAPNDFAMYKTDQIHGIPLTPEILEKAGFNKIYDSWGQFGGYVNGFICLSSDYAYSFANEVDEWSYIRKIKYVHELQNIVYTTTGEELNIEL